MAFTPVTITGNLINPDGSLASGAMTFTLSSGMEDSGSGQIVVPEAIVGQVYQGKLLSVAPGNPPLVLLANDDPTTLPSATGPSATTYTVHEELTAGSLPDWQLSVHHTGTTQDISGQRPTP